MGIKNAIKREKFQKTNSPFLSYSPKGKTQHGINRLRQRAPEESFPFSLKKLKEMVNKRVIQVRKGDNGNKLLVLNDIGFKVVVNKKINKFISVWRI